MHDHKHMGVHRTLMTKNTKCENYQKCKITCAAADHCPPMPWPDPRNSNWNEIKSCPKIHFGCVKSSLRCDGWLSVDPHPLNLFSYSYKTTHATEGSSRDNYHVAKHALFPRLFVAVQLISPEKFCWQSSPRSHSNKGRQVQWQRAGGEAVPPGQAGWGGGKLPGGGQDGAGARIGAPPSAWTLHFALTPLLRII